MREQVALREGSSRRLALEGRGVREGLRALRQHPHVRLLLLSVPFLAAAQMLGHIGALTAPGESLRAYVAEESPFLGAACAGGFLLFGAHVRRQRSGKATIVAALLLGVALDFFLSRGHWLGAGEGAAFPFASDGVGFCVAAALVAVARGLLLRARSDLQCAATVVLLPLFVLLANSFLDATIRLHPAVLDPPAVLVESAISPSLGFHFARFVLLHPALSFALTSAYFGLPLAFAIASLAERRPSDAGPDALVAFAAVGLAGFLCYHLCPIIGPQPFFSDDWPWAIPDLRQLTPSAVRTESFEPRNCLPSLHTAWALVLYWHARARERGPRPGRAFLAFLALTLLATVGLGQHYVIDLLAAFPFALAAWALLCTDVPWSASASARRRALVFGGAGLLAWIVLVRVGATLARRAPPSVWALGIASVLGTLWLEARLRRAFKRAADAPPRRGSRLDPG